MLPRDGCPTTFVEDRTSLVTVFNPAACNPNRHKIIYSRRALPADDPFLSYIHAGASQQGACLVCVGVRACSLSLLYSWT